MINYFTKPHPCLADFIDTYILSASDRSELSFTGTWPASNETSLVFYLADKPEQLGARNGSEEKWHMGNCVVGVLTRNNGAVSFSGRYKTFVIHFKPNGFSRIFGIPAPGLTDQVLPSEDVFGPPVSALYEKLLNTEGILEMASFSDLFLIHMLNKRKPRNENAGITFVSNLLLRGDGLLNVAGYASQANMSVRNFERRFSEQVGVSPKLFFRLLRFNNAVNAKVYDPSKNWTAIAHEFGYYDQMHLIKDFRDFADATPTSFFAQTTELAGEQFVAVKRPAY
jgi:AraC-like DNA-binding protein